MITLADGSARKFFEFDLLKPYVAAWEARREEIARKQAEYDDGGLAPPPVMT